MPIVETARAADGRDHRHQRDSRGNLATAPQSTATICVTVGLRSFNLKQRKVVPIPGGPAAYKNGTAGRLCAAGTAARTLPFEGPIINGIEHHANLGTGVAGAASFTGHVFAAGDQV